MTVSLSPGLSDRASTICVVIAVSWIAAFGTNAQAQGSPISQSEIFPDPCESPNQTPQCAFKTWLACDTLKGSFCTLVGLPERNHDYAEDARQEHAARIAQEPAFAEVMTAAFEHPWELSVQDILSVSPFLPGEAEISGPVRPHADRMGRGMTLPQTLEGSLEIMLYRGIFDDVWNYSVFLGKRDETWVVLGWHRAYASFSMARFGDILNPLASEWIETCGLGYVDCMNSGFLFGLMPYDVYQALKKEPAN